MAGTQATFQILFVEELRMKKDILGGCKQRVNYAVYQFLVSGQPIMCECCTGV